MINKDEIYTPKEVANFLKVTSTYINNLCKIGKIKASKLEGNKRITWRIKGQDLLDYIEK